MSPAQADLLRRLIEADRRYRQKVKDEGYADADLRGVEIGWINGVNPRTAESLVAAGLAETSQGAVPTQTYIYLGKCSPYDN